MLLMEMIIFLVGFMSVDRTRPLANTYDSTGTRTLSSRAVGDCCNQAFAQLCAFCSPRTGYFECYGDFATDDHSFWICQRWIVANRTFAARADFIAALPSVIMRPLSKRHSMNKIVVVIIFIAALTACATGQSD